MTTEHSPNTGYLTLNRLLRKEVLSPKQAQLGYVMAETRDNQLASLAQASDLLRQGVIEKIAIPNPLPPYDYGYPGPDYCKQILLKAGVQESQVTIISPDKHLSRMNTQTELNMVAEYLRKTNYNDNIIIVVPWFHALRSYITALSELKKNDLNVKVFVSSVPLGVFEIVTHSQGIQEGSRRKIFYEEIRKCYSYNNLISIKEAIETHKKQHNKASN